MKNAKPPLRLRDVLRRRGVLTCVCADILRRADVALRFGFGSDRSIHQRATGEQIRCRRLRLTRAA